MKSSIQKTIDLLNELEKVDKPSIIIVKDLLNTLVQKKMQHDNQFNKGR